MHTTTIRGAPREIRPAPAPATSGYGGAAAGTTIRGTSTPLNAAAAKTAPSNCFTGVGFRVVLVGELKAKTPPIAPAPFVLLAKDAKAERKFATLDEAVTAAQSGDTIEIRGNGPFVTEPIDLQTKDLVVRAGQGFRPVLKQKPETIAALAPLIYTKGSLVLEGLELQRTGSEKMAGWDLPWSPMTRRSTSPNCRFLSSINDKANASILFQDNDLCEIRNSLFLAGQNTGFGGLGSTNRVQVVLENNLGITDGVGWVFNLDPEPDGGDVPIRITRNTLGRGLTMALDAELPPMKQKKNAFPRLRFESQGKCR